VDIFIGHFALLKGDNARFGNHGTMNLKCYFIILTPSLSVIPRQSPEQSEGGSEKSCFSDRKIG
jgi:hypothetical protein